MLDQLLIRWLNTESRRSRNTQPKRDSGESCGLCSVSPYAVAAEFPVYLPHDVTHSVVLELTAFEMNTMDTYKDDHLQDLLVNEPTPDNPYGLGDVDRHVFLSGYEAAFIPLLCAEICLQRQDVWFAMEHGYAGSACLADEATGFAGVETPKDKE